MLSSCILAGVGAEALKINKFIRWDSNFDSLHYDRLKDQFYSKHQHQNYEEIDALSKMLLLRVCCGYAIQVLKII